MRIFRRENAVLPVKANIARTYLRYRPGIELVTVFFLKCRAVRVGHVVDKVDFTGPECSQANAVFLLWAADEAVEIW